MSAADQPLLDGGTQWNPLSATVKQPAYRYVVCVFLQHHSGSALTITTTQLIPNATSALAKITRP